MRIYKKKFKLFVIIIGFFMCLCIIFLLVTPKVMINKYNNAVVIFDDTSELSKSDSSEIEKILSGNMLIPLGDKYFCENSVCIKFDEQEFWLDFTGDNVVYYKNKDKFIYLSSIQNAKLHSILKKYGVYFPAI